MSRLLLDGLARLQNKSRIPASKWREWCDVLGLDPVDAGETWEEVCYPLMIATRIMPVQEVSYILQMRASRPELNIFDFKEEVPRILHAITFLYDLKDERLTKGRIKSYLFKFYKKSSIGVSANQIPSAFIQCFIVELCSLVVIVKVLRRASISLSGALKLLIEGHGCPGQLVELGRNSLGEISYAEAVRDFLESLDLESKDSGTQSAVKDTAGDLGVAAAGEGGVGALKGDVATCLKKFKIALEAIYKEEAVNGEVIQESAVLLSERLKAIIDFNPLQAVVPDLEEAQAIARRRERAKSASHGGKAAVNINAASGAVVAASAGDISSGPAGSGRGEVGKFGAAAAAMPSSRSNKMVEAEGSELGDVDPPESIEVEIVTKGEFSDRIYEIGGLLSSIEPADQKIWSIFLEPDAQIENLPVFARALTIENTSTYQVYTAIKRIAQLAYLKKMIPVHDIRELRKRNFTSEVTIFANSVKNTTRSFSPSDRQLAPLARILDHASAALLRLEALRTNYVFGLHYPDNYSEEAVLRYCEEVLHLITDLAERTILEQARQLADLDTSSMLELFAANKFVEQLLETCCDYVQKLKDQGHVQSPQQVGKAIADNALEFSDVEMPGAPPEAMPAQLLQASEMGEVFDAVYAYLVTRAWRVMGPIHEPEKTAARLKEMLRKSLVSSFVLRAEKKRHHENPHLALSVVGLDKICGDPNFKDLCIRVDEDGKVIYHDDFEDGSYVDLFELREYKPSRVHVRAKEEARQNNAEELQTGSKYLYTVGCTNQLFGKSPSVVINNCIRNEDGSPKVFPIFN